MFSQRENSYNQFCENITHIFRFYCTSSPNMENWAYFWFFEQWPDLTYFVVCWLGLPRLCSQNAETDCNRLSRMLGLSFTCSNSDFCSLFSSTNCSHRQSGANQSFFMFRGVTRSQGREGSSVNYSLTAPSTISPDSSLNFWCTNTEVGIIFKTRDRVKSINSSVWQIEVK